MTLALGTLYAWSVFVTPLENEFGWKRAQTSSGFYARRGHVRGLAASRRKTAGPLRPFLDLADWKLLLSLEFLALCLHLEPLLSLFFSTACWAASGLGFGFGRLFPVMAKWFPDRTGLAIGLALAGFGGGSAIFGSFANLVLFPRFGWRAFLHDPRRNFSGDDHDGGFSAEESGDRAGIRLRIVLLLPARRLPATSSLPAKSCARRPFICCGLALASGPPRGSWSSAS